MIKKYSFYKPLLDSFKERVKANSIPVEIVEGDENKDFGGNVHVEVLLDYRDDDAYLVNKCLCETINENFLQE